MTPDLSVPLRNALIGASTITSELNPYKGSYPVFTRRPVPDDAKYPMMLVSPDISLTEQDGVDDQRPIIVRDIIAYGLNDTPEHYRAIDTIAFAVRDLFHRQPQSITVPEWVVIQIRATGPIAGPTDDQNIIARAVSLTISLAQLGL